MKNLLTAFLPALALLALGGCAGTSALTSSEDDGVYYSSNDRTTAVVQAEPAGTDEATNPDYNDRTATSSSRQNRGSDQYYDNTYSYMRGVPNYGVAAYIPYSPYTSFGYGVGSYGWGGGACGFSPYGFYDPFADPFGYGYGSSISISFGFGRPWGYGGYGGYGYGRPYGYGGYGGGFYDPYYYSSPFYGGYYGRGGYGRSGGYYGNAYGSGYGNGNGYYNNDRNYRNRREVTAGHRNDRMSDGRYSSGNASSPAPTTGGATTTGGRMRSSDGVVTPGNPPISGVSGSEGRRMRGETAPGTSNTPPVRAEESFNRPRRMEGADQPRYRTMDQTRTSGQPADGTPGPGQTTRDENRGRWRSPDISTQSDRMQPQPTATPQPRDGQRRRGGFSQDVLTQPRNDDGQTSEQPTRQRSYEQPRQPRAEQPQQRAYEQPQQRSYEQPQQRSNSQPSYSAPSGGGGGRGRSRGE